MNFIMWMRFLPQIIGAVIVIAKALESAIPEDGFGSDKLAALDDILEDIIEASDDMETDYNIIRPRVHKIAGVVVNLLNKVGW